MSIDVLLIKTERLYRDLYKKIPKEPALKRACEEYGVEPVVFSTYLKKRRKIRRKYK